MSHFKINNRFDDMNNENVDESNPYRKQNNERGDRNTSENSFRSYEQRYTHRRREENRHTEKQSEEEKKRELAKLKKQKENETEKILQKSNFPELISPKAEKDTPSKPTDAILFAERIKNSIAENEMNLLTKDVKPMIEPGCVSLSFDKRNIQWTYGPSKYMDYAEDDSYNVLSKLVELNEKHRKEYVDCWGEEEYEKMFKMPNYDYAYFDTLDELYEEEINAMSEEEEYYNNYNEYSY